MFELATTIGFALIDIAAISLSPEEYYYECDFSSNTRSRRLRLDINTDRSNSTYEINLNFRSEPKVGEVIE